MSGTPFLIFSCVKCLAAAIAAVFESSGAAFWRSPPGNLGRRGRAL